MIQRIAFFAYPVSDVTAARAFYEGRLGLKVTSSYEGFWIEYDLGDTTFAIAKSDAEHPVPVKGAIVAFEVDDLDAAVAKLKSEGVRFKQDPMDTPVCRMAIALDPDGNEMILHRCKG
jgi:predicted enzyme related to lactoylglutathione lyase